VDRLDLVGLVHLICQLYRICLGYLLYRLDRMGLEYRLDLEYLGYLEHLVDRMDRLDRLGQLDQLGLDLDRIYLGHLVYRLYLVDHFCLGHRLDLEDRIYRLDLEDRLDRLGRRYRLYRLDRLDQLYLGHHRDLGYLGVFLA